MEKEIEEKVKTPVAEKPKAAEMVSIDKGKLDSILSKVEKQDKQIGMLIEVADKARLHRFESANKDMSQKTIKVSTFKGKVIIGWKMAVDDMYQDSQGRWHEKQEVDLFFIDNTKERINYLMFTREVKKVDGMLIRRYTNEEGIDLMKIDVLGKEISISETFVN